MGSNIKIHTGISSVIMLLVVLCLTTFGLLSYSTAKADLTLTEKAAEHTYNYYSADLKSEQIVSEMVGIISEDMSFFSKNENWYKEKGILDITEIRSDEGYYIIKFVIPVDKTQNIETTIKIDLLSSSQKKINISKQLISTQEFQEIKDIDVWLG